jgi:hypothetical protein
VRQNGGITLSLVEFLFSEEQIGVILYILLRFIWGDLVNIK